ncbi:hypothetical protein MATL_G00008910 [Megalops atlanticus]|uniref:LITAF domain-containing protein n=1 Tax=Megalops atlanticus TaxID=7932 RepID=A0A9D3QKZ3_MEGAT|nr:hypothetical protein MATL_G00008910 [Megalops atlanticus]
MAETLISFLQALLLLHSFNHVREATYQPQHVVYQAQPQGQTVLVSTQPVQSTPAVICVNNLGDTACMTTCNNCQQRVTTRVLYKAGTFSWVMCFVFIFFGLFCGCCLIPFFMDSFKDAHHSCPQCHTNLYVHKRM